MGTAIMAHVNPYFSLYNPYFSLYNPLLVTTNFATNLPFTKQGLPSRLGKFVFCDCSSEGGFVQEI